MESGKPTSVNNRWKFYKQRSWESFSNVCVKDIFFPEIPGKPFMSYDNFCHVVHATVSDFNCISVKNFVKFVASRKCFATNNWWNVFATFVETDLLKYGLNHTIYFAFAFLFFLSCCWCISNQHYNSTSLERLRFSFRCSKNVSVRRIFGSPSEKEFGNCLMICGGRFDEEWMYSSLSLDFLHGPFCRLSVTLIYR